MVKEATKNDLSDGAGCKKTSQGVCGRGFIVV